MCFSQSDLESRIKFQDWCDGNATYFVTRTLFPFKDSKYIPIIKVQMEFEQILGI